MKGFREYVALGPGRSFFAETATVEAVDYGLHYHPEWELTVFEDAGGIRGVGESLESFRGGDIALMAANTPHFWNIPPADALRSSGPVELNIVKFAPAHWRETLMLPELRAVRSVLHGECGAYAISGIDKRSVIERIHRIRDARSAEGLALLLALLARLAEHAYLRPLMASRYGFPKERSGRLKRVLDVVNKRFREQLRLATVAEVAGMSPTAFSRYFRTAMGTPFSSYVRRLRISWASNRLLDSEETVLAVALEAGYQSLTNFNRLFRKEQGMTPREYRNRFRSER